MFGQAQKRSQRKEAAKTTKLHSIAGMLRGRNCEGSFEVGGASYSFKYSLEGASVTSNKLQVTGAISITRIPPDASGSPGVIRAVIPGRVVRNIRATLLAIQGGVGTAPPREKLPSDVSTAHPDLPIVESTGSLSFCGVLYLKLAPLQGSALGVSADMTQVQLNLRLAPVSDTERRLQAAFSSVSDALYGKGVDRAAAESAVVDLNRILSL